MGPELPFGRPERATVFGCVALVTTKGLDTAATLYALRVGYTEANPVAAAAFDAVGPVPAALALSALVVVALVAAAELGRRALEAHTDSLALSLPRALAYGVPSALFLSVGVHNLALLAR